VRVSAYIVIECRNRGKGVVRAYSSKNSSAVGEGVGRWVVVIIIIIIVVVVVVVVCRRVSPRRINAVGRLSAAVRSRSEK